MTDPQEFGSVPKDDDDEEPAALTLEETRELAEEGVLPQQVQPERVSAIDYERFFNEIFLEVYDVEHGLDRAMENYTKILLSRGITVNPSGLYQQIELIQTRLVKLAIVKRICSALGLIAEMDSVLDREMGLIYDGRKTVSPARQYSRVTAGDADQEPGGTNEER